jgi:hypothetical protein
MKLRAWMLFIILTEILFSCSKQNRQGVAKDSVASGHINKTENTVSKDSLAVETDTLDVPDTSIVVFEPSEEQENRLGDKDQDAVEYYADFHAYTNRLGDDLQDRLPIFYTSQRFLKLHRGAESKILDTKQAFHRTISEDAGVIFLKGFDTPQIIRDIWDDYIDTVQKIYNLKIQDTKD